MKHIRRIQFFAASATILGLGLMPSASAASGYYTYRNAKSTSGTVYSESSGLMRTTSCATLKATDALFTTTVWLGTVSGSSGTHLCVSAGGKLVGAQAKAKFVFKPDPKDKGTVSFMAWVEGVPLGPMRMLQAESLETDSGTYGDVSASVSETSDTVLLEVTKDGYTYTTTVSPGEFAESGISLTVGEGEEALQFVATPESTAVDASMERAGLAAVGAGIFVNEGSVDTVLNIDSSDPSAPDHVRLVAPIQ